jgi:hypothetical protein
MNFRKLAVACAVIAAPIGAPAVAQDYSKSAINDSAPASLGLYGAQSSVVDDAAVPGGKALRVVVPAKGANPWDAGLQSGIRQPIRAGDELVLAFWARLVNGEAGATSATLPTNVGLTSPPWTGVFGQPVTIGTGWKLFEVRGRADKDYPAGSLGAGIQLAGGKQTIDFGPLYVARLGGGAATGAGSSAPAAKPSALATLDPARIPEMLLNVPGEPQINKAKGRLIDDKEVMGGKAVRVAVAAKGQNDWDSNVGSDIKKPVKAGDNLLLVFWARLEQGPNGATTTTIPASVSLRSPPWSGLLGGPAEIGPEWKRFEFEGKADKDYAPGAIGVGINIGQAKQTIDFGPILLLDLNK